MYITSSQKCFPLSLNLLLGLHVPITYEERVPSDLIADYFRCGANFGLKKQRIGNDSVGRPDPDESDLRRRASDCAPFSKPDKIREFVRAGRRGELYAGRVISETGAFCEGAWPTLSLGAQISPCFFAFTVERETESLGHIEYCF